MPRVTAALELGLTTRMRARVSAMPGSWNRALPAAFGLSELCVIRYPASAAKDGIMQAFDLVIRGGTLVTATDTVEADVGIRGEMVAAIGRGLDQGRREIDARGKLVMPGGVDSHCHIEQLSASGLMNADTFHSATASA